MQPIEILNSILHQLSNLIMWIVFATFNLSLISIALLCFWLFSISPSQLFSWMESWYYTSHLTTVVSLILLLGGSLGTVIYWYSRAYCKLYKSLINPYLFKNIDDFYKKILNR